MIGPVAPLKTEADVLAVLKGLGGPIRVPTACWLCSDLLNLLDTEVRLFLDILIVRGTVTLAKGGWLALKEG